MSYESYVSHLFYSHYAHICTLAHSEICRESTWKIVIVEMRKIVFFKVTENKNLARYAI